MVEASAYLFTENAAVTAYSWCMHQVHPRPMEAMKYFTCQTRFHQPIRDSIKQSTIRKKQKVRVGEMFALRYWTGAPYRSKMGTLGIAKCLEISNIRITADVIKLLCVQRLFPDGNVLTSFDSELMPLDRLVAIEGFRDWPDMSAWFVANHHTDSKPLDAVLTYWGETFQPGADEVRP